MQLEQQLEQLTQNGFSPNQVTLDPKMMDDNLFAMRQGYQPGQTEMPKLGSFLKISDGNVLVIALGVITSQTVGGFVNRFLPMVGKFSTILAGLALMYFGKSKKLLRDFGVGVLLGGLASEFSGLGSRIGGMLGGQTSMPMDKMVEEDKMTYGGTDGVYPVQPDRRIFQ